MNKDLIIEIGDTAEDMITGFHGLVMCHTIHLNNCDTFGIQPRELKDGEPAKPKFFDAPQVKLRSKGVLPACEPAPLTVDLGAEVEDTLSPYKGVVIGIATWINGCRRVGIQSPKLHEGKPVDDQWMPMSQVRLVKPAPPAQEDKPGGPMREPQGQKAPR